MSNVSGRQRPEFGKTWGSSQPAQSTRRSGTAYRAHTDGDTVWQIFHDVQDIPLLLDLDSPPPRLQGWQSIWQRPDWEVGRSFWGLVCVLGSSFAVRQSIKRGEKREKKNRMFSGVFVSLIQLLKTNTFAFSNCSYRHSSMVMMTKCICCNHKAANVGGGVWKGVSGNRTVNSPNYGRLKDFTRLEKYIQYQTSDKRTSH